ncbi:MAG: arsenate reductase family protein [Chitinophagales bacterium]
MNKVYYLKSCSTCSRINKELGVSEANFEMQNIKTKAITQAQLEEMHKLSGSYEALFSKRSQKYKALGLKDKNLSEDDMKNYILEEYTFLSRPVFIINNKIFIGNSKKNVEAVKEVLK